MTISSLSTPFDHSLCLSTLSNQAVNILSVDDFAPDPRSRLLSYHHCRLHCSPHQAINISSIDKPSNCRFYSTSLSTSSQISVSADTPRIHNPCFCYSYNSR